MHIILSVRGTFGSGKTTAVREFMTNYPTVELCNKAGKPMGYRVDASKARLKSPIFVIGSYRNTCGGTDTIATQQEIVDRIMLAHPLGHVLFEGALVSASGVNGTVTQAIHPTMADCYAFLDTPLETCIQRVEQRRATKGNETPLDPKNLVQKFEGCVATYKAFRAAGSYPTYLIDHRNVHPALLGLIRKYDDGFM